MVYLLAAVLVWGALSFGRSDLEGNYYMTFYWTVHPEDIKGEGRIESVYDIQNNEIAKVDVEYLKAISLEGSGYLPDGRLVNLACACPYPNSRFFVVDTNHAIWGYGAKMNPLHPFKSIAVDPTQIPLGTKVFIPAFKGVILDDRQPHDGCFVAADTGYGVFGKHIDVFSGTKKSYYKAIKELKNASRVQVREATSEDGCVG